MTTGTLLAAEGAPGLPVLPTPDAPAKPVVDAAAASYPVPGKIEDMGKGIQRTMKLLATSTPQKHNRVKVLVYGQSISEQNWWKLVNEDLRKRFPDADLVMENRAIGGFASQLLINPLQHDVYTFYPDLVIFHVYGSHVDYDGIIAGIRSHTAAEILIQKDHVTKWPDLNATEQTNKGMWWDNFMNGKVLPEAATKHNCGIVDVRSGWVEYLKANTLEPKALLTDAVHLNDKGCQVMAGFINQYLVYRPELPVNEKLVVDTPVKAEQWKGGELTVEFEGNRVDLVAAAGEGEADVLIDGKAPSQHEGCYMITRPTPRPWSPMFLARVDHDAPLQLEGWTLTITKVSEDKKTFEYDVEGSKTGADGHGSSGARFRSNSGRAIIDGKWFFKGHGEIAVGYKIKWEVAPFFQDTYAAPSQLDLTREATVCVAQGLTNGKHTLTLRSKSGQAVPVAAVRAYCPPEKVGEREVGK